MTRTIFLLELRGVLSLAFFSLLGVLGLGYVDALAARMDVFSHVRVHAAVGLVVLSFLLIALKARKRAMTAMIAGLAALAGLIFPLYLDAARVQPKGTDLSLVSFNMLYINERPLEVIALLEKERPDAVFILEAPALFPYLDRLRRTYPFMSGCTHVLACDLLVLSQTPLSAVQRPGPQAAWDRAVAARITVNGAPVNLLAIHLSKPDDGDEQRQQLRHIGAIVDDMDGPVIVAGDFNATPWSPTVRRFAAAHDLKTLAGYRATWPSWAGPFGFPIDLVMARGAVPTRIKTLDASYGSNHLGLSAGFALAGQGG